MARKTTDTESADATQVAAPMPNTSVNLDGLPAPGRLVRPISVALVSDDPAIHRLVQQAVWDTASGWRLDSYPNVAQALKHIPPVAPDVVLLDLFAPETGGARRLCLFKAAAPAVPIIVLSASKGRADLFSAMAAGACAYLIKPTAPSQIVRAILRAHAGLESFCPQAEQLLPGHGHHGAVAAGPHASLGLTPREHEFVACQAKGYSQKDIADALGISHRSVDDYRRSVFRKLDVHSRAQALARYSSLQ